MEERGQIPEKSLRKKEPEFVMGWLLEEDSKEVVPHVTIQVVPVTEINSMGGLFFFFFVDVKNRTRLTYILQPQ